MGCGSPKGRAGATVLFGAATSTASGCCGSTRRTYRRRRCHTVVEVPDDDPSEPDWKFRTVADDLGAPNGPEVTEDGVGTVPLGLTDLSVRLAGRQRSIMRICFCCDDRPRRG